jgi:tRNA dimethylallyltransferase
MAERPVLVVLGATATGKSALALTLAERFGGEIVNADALQVYRGLDVGTAKPSPEERVRVPHHLLDVIDPSERFSAGEFGRRARVAVAEIRSRNGWPLVVGGSGFYLRALLAGLSPVPPADPAVREALRREREELGLPALYARLAQVDPETAARLPPGDAQRILRALEVAAVSGAPLSTWIARKPLGEENLAAIRIGLTLPRTILYDRIERRVVEMVDRGWVREVEHLLESGLSPECPAFQAIGYRQLVRHVQGDWTLGQAVSEIVQATRRFAKRQETWFRREPEVIWIDARDAERGAFHALRSISGGDLGVVNA